MKKIITLTFLGIAIGCTIISAIGIIMALSVGYENFIMDGTTYVNSILGASVVGICFSIPTLIYEYDEIPLLYQTAFQMGIGYVALLIVGAYLNWIPLDEGIGPIATWIAIALVWGFAMWLGFYLMGRNEAKKINEQLNKFK